MASDHGHFVSEVVDDDVELLTEALRSQQQLLQKVYFELEEEREASSSAASEAMLMILRLQAEKAQVKMEASQYEREVEENLDFAEESIAMYEDLMYQKEKEIAYLDFQIQTYTSKLESMGCTELNIPEHQIVPAETHKTTTALTIIPPQLPLIVPKKTISTAIIEKERPAIPLPKVFLKKAAGTSKGDHDLNAYWERIRKLDEQVKAFSDGKVSRRRRSSTNFRNRLRSSSVPPPEFDDSCSGSVAGDNPEEVDGVATRLDQVNKFFENLEEKKVEADGDESALSSVQEKFQVPKIIRMAKIADLTREIDSVKT